MIHAPPSPPLPPIALLCLYSHLILIPPSFRPFSPSPLLPSFPPSLQVGYGDIIPQNNTEKIANILSMFIGATVFGYIVGSMASLVGKFDAGAAQYKDRMDELNAYLRERKISKELRQKVRR